jgi:hypothetical protein
MIVNVHWSSRYSCQILMKLKSAKQIFEKWSNIKNSMQIIPAGAELFHTDGRTRQR